MRLFFTGVKNARRTGRDFRPATKLPIVPGRVFPEEMIDLDYLANRRGGGSRCRVHAPFARRDNKRFYENAQSAARWPVFEKPGKALRHPRLTSRVTRDADVKGAQRGISRA